MKIVFFLLVILYCGCTNLGSLNDQIYEAQKQAVLQSPYKSAEGALGYVEAQKSYRLNNLPKLLNDKITFNTSLKDTIWLAESFDAICINCPSDWMKILYNDTVYTLQREILGRNKISYKTRAEPFAGSSNIIKYELRHSEFIEVIQKIQNNESWTATPLQYGSDGCFDGDHTIITAIYPDKTIEALYVRCWRPMHYNQRN